MSRLKVFLLVVAIIAVHAGLLLAFGNVRPLPIKPQPAAPEDEFTPRSITYVNEAGEPQKVVREFTVSTKLYGETPPQPTHGRSPELARP